MYVYKNETNSSSTFVNAHLTSVNRAITRLKYIPAITIMSALLAEHQKRKTKLCSQIIGQDQIYRTIFSSILKWSMC